jgi:hypothetical protein
MNMAYKVVNDMTTCMNKMYRVVNEMTIAANAVVM